LTNNRKRNSAQGKHLTMPSAISTVFALSPAHPQNNHREAAK
jgi:hypothetical protein